MLLRGIELQSQIIHVCVYDSTQKTPLGNVKALSGNGTLIGNSNLLGQIIIDQKLLKKGIDLYKEGYSKKSISLINANKSDSIVVLLALKENKLNEIEISANKNNTLFFTGQAIEDVIVHDKNHILLLISGKNKGHFSLNLINFKGELLQKSEIKSEPVREFFKDCNQNHHLILRDSASQIVFFKDSFFLNYKQPMQTIKNLLYPCKLAWRNKAIIEVLSPETKIEGVYFNNKAPAFYTDYFIYYNGQKRFFKRIYLNEHIKEMCLEELKYEKFWKGIKSDQAIESQRSFYFSKIYKTPHLFFFKTEPSGFITYDLENESLSHFDLNSDSSKSLPLSGLQGLRDYKIQQDEKTRNIYFMKDGSTTIYQHHLSSNQFQAIQLPLNLAVQKMIVDDAILFYTEKSRNSSNFFCLKYYEIK